MNRENPTSFNPNPEMQERYVDRRVNLKVAKKIESKFNHAFIRGSDSKGREYFILKEIGKHNIESGNQIILSEFGITSIAIESSDSKYFRQDFFDLTPVLDRIIGLSDSDKMCANPKKESAFYYAANEYNHWSGFIASNSDDRDKLNGLTEADMAPAPFSIKYHSSFNSVPPSISSKLKKMFKYSERQSFGKENDPFTANREERLACSVASRFY